MKHSLAVIAAFAAACGGLVACSADEPVIDVCKVARLEFIELWYGEGFTDDGTTKNDCRYRSDVFGSIHISARLVDVVPAVRAQFQYNDPTPEFDDELLAAYLEEVVYGADRHGPTVDERMAALEVVPDTEYPCSTTFRAGSDAVMISIDVREVDGDISVGPLRAEFGSSLTSTACSDEVDEPQQPTVDERWLATYEEIQLVMPPGNDCGPATIVVTDVRAFPPDGRVVPLGDLTMTNTNWMVEPPFECRRT